MFTFDLELAGSHLKKSDALIDLQGILSFFYIMNPFV